MLWEREKFIKNMGKILEVYRNHKQSFPEVLQPFLRLYADLNDLNAFKVNEGMQDLKDLLKFESGAPKLKQESGSMCDFIAYDKIAYEKPRFERLKVVVSAPAMLLNIEDPTISARYYTTLEIMNNWGIEGITLVGMLNKQTRWLFRDICQLNLIRLDDDMLNDFMVDCSHDIGFVLNANFPPIAKNVSFEHPDRWEKGRLRVLLKWNLPLEISIERAIELAIEKRDIWNKIRDEMTHGLGVW